MKVRPTPCAYQDLKDIHQYISETLCNPSAALSIVQDIIMAYKNLEDMPYMGVSLRSKVSFDTSIRFIIARNHLVFYEVNEIDNFVEIIRVIRENRDYLKILFP
jgi:plasmid stabilization system protein ParE